MRKLTAILILSATAAAADLAVIRDGKFTGTFYPTDEARFREFHAARGETCVWLDERPAVTNRTRLRAQYRLPTPAELASNVERLAWGNAFLLLCDRVTGATNHVKLTFEQLPAVLLPIKAADREAYEDARDAFDLINSACFKKFGLAWWDQCVWTDDTNVTAAAQQILAGVGVTE